MKALVSIVIPTFNRANDLKRALNSVVNQTYANWECLVVDNHSTDNTDEIIAQFNDSRIKLYKIHNDGIIAKSRNKGIQEARGEYIAFLDSDDWWMSEKLYASCVALDKGADVVYHDLFLVKKNNQRCFFRTVKSRNISIPVYDHLILHGNALSNSSVVVRRQLLLGLKGLSEDKNIIGIEDFYFWLELAKLTDKFKRLLKPYGYYWAGGGNTSNPARQIQCLAQIQEDFSGDFKRLSLDYELWWLLYAEGRACYLAQRFIEAKQKFKQISLKNKSFLMVAKLIWMRSILFRT